MKDFNTLTEIAIYLVCEGKNPHTRSFQTYEQRNYETYAQLMNQLNNDFRGQL